MKTPLVAVAIACMLAGAVAGCSARRSAALRLSTGETASLAETHAAGRRAFARHCHECHPGGDAGLGPAINNKPLPQGLIKLQVRHGLGAMPAFSAEHLSDAELDAITAYLVALRRSS